MPQGVGEIINSVADIFGQGPASKQANAVESAAQKGADAASQSLNLQWDMFNQQIELHEPWRAAGVNALTKMRGGDYSAPPTFAFNYNQNTDPGTQFRLQQGLNAMNATAAARGGLISGNALKAGQDYGQAQGSQEYENAFNRYLTSYNAGTNQANTMYNRSASLAGIGQTATNQLGSQAGQYGANAGNIAMTAGANAGNAQLALGNIRGSQYGNYGNALGKLGSMAGSMFGSDTPSYSGPSYGSNPDVPSNWYDSNSYD